MMVKATCSICGYFVNEFQEKIHFVDENLYSEAELFQIWNAEKSECLSCSDEKHREAFRWEGDLPGYTIFNNGAVYSQKKRKFLKPDKDNYGYLRVRLHFDGKVKRIRLHRLVAYKFLSRHRMNSTDLIRHLDDDKENNHVSNLAWGDHKQNMEDRKKNKRSKTNV